jgi:hypothetical protein
MPTATDLDSALADWLRLASRSFAEVLGLPADHPKVLAVQELARLEPQSVVDTFLDAARARARSDSAHATMLAVVAVLRAQELPALPALPAYAPPPPSWPGLLASAYCHLADLIRMAGSLPATQQALARAASHLEAVPACEGEPRAIYLAALSRLRRAQGRARLAADLLEQSFTITRRMR